MEIRFFPFFLFLVVVLIPALSPRSTASPLVAAFLFFLRSDSATGTQAQSVQRGCSLAFGVASRCESARLLY